VSRGLTKITGSIILTVLWVCAFLFIRQTLVIDFGAGIIFNFKFFVILLGLLIIVLYNIFYRSSPEVTKLSFTVALTIAWIALIFFYHFQPLQGTEAEYAAGIEYDGSVGFFTIVGGLLVCLLWIRFFSDEISLDDKK
jgi:4-amino-4-deoxy-L-arabinose transferase-like glycosyltransferase